ncbi:MAG: OmpA family protein [Tetrasphaera sp.]
MRSTLCGLVAALTLAAPTAAAANDRDEALASLPKSAWPASITKLDRSVTELDRNVTKVDTKSTEGPQTVISLASDVLFAFDKDTISDRAEDKIRELIADIPDGATVQVHGHTDNIGEQAYNQKLSESRAKTVANVISAERADLRLEVKGFGMSDPVESNEKPEGRALNRRVEIRYRD